MFAVLLVIIAILLFCLIMFIHELGHFLTAKASGVKVNEFALGMGPKIFKFKRGETVYSLRAFPIGGFCSMEGEDAESDDEGSFSRKPVWKRIIIVSAGAIMNIILGFILMFFLLIQNNYYASTTVAKFSDNSMSHATGLEVEDRIISINGYKIYTDKDIVFVTSISKNCVMNMVVERNGENVTLDNVHFPQITDENGNESISLDFYLKPIPRTFFSLIDQTFKNVISILRIVWMSLIGLITGKFGVNEVSGPVGAAAAISSAASEGLSRSFLQAVNNIVLMMVILTVNLGIVNLLPLPALDGGRLIFLIIEAIRRKPVNPKYEGYIHATGFVLLMILTVVVAFNDIFKLSTGKGIGG